MNVANVNVVKKAVGVAPKKDKGERIKDEGKTQKT